MLITQRVNSWLPFAKNDSPDLRSGMTSDDLNSLSCNINMHVLLTVLHVFLMVPARRICLHIKTLPLVTISFVLIVLYV